MSDERSGPYGGLSRRPRAIALIDLMALVAGVALVLPLQEIFGDSWITAARVSEPWATFLKVGEFTSKAGIALMPVVLVLHLRSGGVFRPAEWLLITIATRSVHLRLVFAGGMDWAAQSLGWGPGAGRFRAWYAFGMIGFLVVVAALSASRRTAPIRLKLPLLLCLPLFAVWGPAILFSNELDVLWRALWPSVAYRSLTRTAYLGLMQSPEQVLVCLPFVASLRDLARRDRPAWTWGEWLGFGIALITATAGLIAITAAHRVNFPQLSERLADLSVWAGWWLAELAIAWVAVRYLGRVWEHWIAPQKIHPPLEQPRQTVISEV